MAHSSTHLMLMKISRMFTKGSSHNMFIVQDKTPSISYRTQQQYGQFQITSSYIVYTESIPTTKKFESLNLKDLNCLRAAFTTTDALSKAFVLLFPEFFTILPRPVLIWANLLVPRLERVFDFHPCARPSTNAHGRKLSCKTVAPSFCRVHDIIPSWRSVFTGTVFPMLSQQLSQESQFWH